MESGQGNSKKLGQLDIVATDQRQLVRNPDPELTRGFHYPNGLHVVGGKDGAGPVVTLQQIERGAVAALGGEGCVDDEIGIDRKTAVLQGTGVSSKATARAGYMRRSRDVSNTPVPQLDQQSGRGVARRFVVRDHDIVERIAEGA